MTWRYTLPSHAEENPDEQRAYRKSQPETAAESRAGRRPSAQPGTALCGSPARGKSHAGLGRADLAVRSGRGIYQDALALMRTPNLSVDALSMSLRNLLVAGAAPCLFVMLAAAGASVMVAMAQNRGLRLQPAGIAPKWSRLNPAENAKHLFTTRAVVRLGKSLIPVLLLAVQLVHFITALTAMPVFSLARLPLVFGDAYQLLVNTAWIMLAWSLVDYVVEWRQWESRLKMSKQDMREEFKETEGNPQMKGRIRSLQRQMRRRMLRADVNESKRGDYQSHALCGGAFLRFEHDGSPQGAGERPRSAGGADQGRSPLGRRAAGRKSAACALALPPGGAGPELFRRSFTRRWPHPGLPLPPGGGRTDAPRSRAAAQECRTSQRPC